MKTKEGPRCSKCRWVDEADSGAKTSFRGVGLCPLHAAAPGLLALLQEARERMPLGTAKRADWLRRANAAVTAAEVKNV